MTYSISLTCHGASADDAKAVFEDTVRAFRKINAEGSDPTTWGSIGGTDRDGKTFTLSANAVEELTEADVVEEEIADDDES